MLPDVFRSHDEDLAGPGGDVFGDTRQDAPFDHGAILALRRFYGERGHIRVVPRRKIPSVIVDKLFNAESPRWNEKAGSMRDAVKLPRERTRSAERNRP